VRSVHADANPEIFGDISFASGGNITLTQVGNTITIASTPPPGALTGKFIAQGTTDPLLPNAQFLGLLGTGIIKNATTSGILSIAVANTDYADPTAFYVVGKSTNAPANAINIASAGQGVLMQAVSGSPSLSAFSALNMVVGQIPFGSGTNGGLAQSANLSYLSSGGNQTLLVGVPGGLSAATNGIVVNSTNNETAATTNSGYYFQARGVPLGSLDALFLTGGTSLAFRMRWLNPSTWTGVTNASFIIGPYGTGQAAGTNSFAIDLINLDVGLGDLITTASKTIGFPYLSTVAGPPSAAPTPSASLAASGGANVRWPIVIDQTNRRFYTYDRGAASWHYLQFDDGAAAGAYSLVTQNPASLANVTNLGTKGNGVLQQTTASSISTPTVLNMAQGNLPFGASDGTLTQATQPRLMYSDAGAASGTLIMAGALTSSTATLANAAANGTYFHMIGEGFAPTLRMTTVNTGPIAGGIPGQFSFRTARGTFASKTASAAGDNLVQFQWAPYDGTNHIISVLLGAGIPSDGSVSTGNITQMAGFCTSGGIGTSFNTSRFTLGVDTDANVYTGLSSITAGGTAGYLYLPALSGSQPSGTPAQVFGGTRSQNRVPIEIETGTNDRLWVYTQSHGWQYQRLSNYDASPTRIPFGAATAGTLTDSAGLTYDDTAATRKVTVTYDASQAVTFTPFVMNATNLPSTNIAQAFQFSFGGTTSWELNEVYTNGTTQSLRLRFRNDLNPSATSALFSVSTFNTISGVGANPITADMVTGDAGVGGSSNLSGTNTSGYLYIPQTQTPTVTPTNAVGGTMGNRRAIALYDNTSTGTTKLYGYSVAKGAWQYAGFYNYDPVNAGRIPFADTTAGNLTDSATLLYDATNSRLLVGAPGTSATVTNGSQPWRINAIDESTDSFKRGVAAQYYSSSAGAYSRLGAFKARGTWASPAALQDNDTIGSVQYLGYQGVAFQQGVELQTFVDTQYDASISSGHLAMTWQVVALPNTFLSPVSGLLMSPAADAVVGSTITVPTNSTTGFAWLPTMSGAPSGTPLVPRWRSSTGTRTAVTNAPMVIDTTDHRLYFNDGSGWHYSTFDDYAATATRVPFGSATAGALTDSANFTYIVGTKTLTLTGDGTFGDPVINLTSAGANDLVQQKWSAAGTENYSEYVFNSGSSVQVINVVNTTLGTQPATSAVVWEDASFGPAFAIQPQAKNFGGGAYGQTAGNTNGFFFWPSVLGVPGTPSAAAKGAYGLANSVASVFDISDLRVYFNIGAAAPHFVQVMDYDPGSNAGRIPFVGSTIHTLTDSANLTYNGTVLSVATATAGNNVVVNSLQNTNATGGAAQEFKVNGAQQVLISGRLGGGITGSSYIVNVTQTATDDQINLKGTGSGSSPITVFTNNSELDVHLGNQNGMLTTSTTGFVWLPTTAGVPSGVPAHTLGARKAIVIDTTDNRLYGYLGGAWHYASFDDGAAYGIHALTTQADSSFPNTTNLGALSTGLLYQTVATSVATPAALGVTRWQVVYGDSTHADGRPTSSANFLYEDTNERVTLLGSSPSIGIRTTNAGTVSDALAVWNAYYNTNTGMGTLAWIHNHTPGTNSMVLQVSASGNTGDFASIASAPLGGGAGHEPFIVITQSNDVMLGRDAALATSATNGYLYIPSVAGVPTGVPAYDSAAPATDRKAVVIDTTDGRLYGYFGGAWHNLTGVSSGGITSLTGDVTGTGPGATATTITASAVTYAKIQNVTNNRILGNVSGGAHAPMELTATDVSTLLGLGTAATHAAGDFLQTANNLSDVTASTARTNLGLGTAATHAAGDFGPSTSKYIVQVADAALPNAQALSALTTGLVKVTTTTGVLSTATAGTDYMAPVSLTSGSVVFSGGGSTLSQDNSNFVWDNTNKRLIINNNGSYTPATGPALTISNHAAGPDSYGTAILLNGSFDQGITKTNANLFIGVNGAYGINFITGVGGSEQMALDSSGTLFTKKILPAADSTYDFGAAGTAWAHGYINFLTVDSSIQSQGSNLTIQNNVSANTSIILDSSQITTTGNIIPAANNLYNLGSSSFIYSFIYAQQVNGVAGAGGLGLQDSDAAAPNCLIDLTNGGLTLRGRTVDIIFQAGTSTTFKVDHAANLIKFVSGNIAPAVGGVSGNVLYSSWVQPTGTVQVEARTWLECIDANGDTVYIQLWWATS
jgi:hypothetical protein